MPLDLSAIRPVLLCGGMGTRLKPLSTAKRPKPFLTLYSDKTMLQETLLRMRGAKSPAVLCNRDHSELVSHDIEHLGIEADIIIKEPISRNTAPAIALAAKHYAEQNKNEVLLFLPCDHVIKDMNAFHHAISESFKYAEDGNIILFGETPHVPDTGYGYIQSESNDVFTTVKCFHEKPDALKAAQYISEGYFWNTGIIMARADAIQQAFQTYANNIYKQINALSAERISQVRYSKIPNISMDYAVLEKMDGLTLYKVSMGWSDIGTIDRLKALA